jgi:DNA-binding MarR family transcriptional regulator
MSRLDQNLLRDVSAECPGFQARVTARAITRFYNAFFQPLDLTAEQFSLLVGIGGADGATVADLAGRAGVDATTLSRNVQNLEKRRLARAEGGRGRAGKRLSLTSSGRRLLLEALPRWERAKTELSKRMGDRRLQLAKQAMAELAVAADVPIAAGPRSTPKRP